MIGIGQSLVAHLGAKIDGLRELPQLTDPGVTVPSIPAALWCRLRGEDRGELLHTARGITADLATAFAVASVVDGFEYAGGRDLSGYEDGTENPTDDAAHAAAARIRRGGRRQTNRAVQKERLARRESPWDPQ